VGLRAADAFQQVEGATRRVEVAEDKQARRARGGQQSRVTFGAGKLDWMTVRGELVGQRSPEHVIALNDKDSIAVATRCWRRVARLDGDRTGGDGLRAHTPLASPSS
jgi:hypothetical protein